MKILLGTHNPSKADYFARQLRDFDVSFMLLSDLGIEKIADEDGKSVLENAAIKAAHYGRFYDYVISADSALYIREIPLDDPRQPGLTIRRADDGHEMTDDEALEHYVNLVRSLGGRITCWYQDAYAVCNRGEVFTFMDDGPVNDVYAFYMVDKPHEARHPGWPLDSISVRPRTGRYFVEHADFHPSEEDEILIRDFQQRRLEFYEKSLGLKRK